MYMCVNSVGPHMPYHNFALFFGTKLFFWGSSPSEQWIGSHPSLKACDVCPSNELACNSYNSSNFTFAMSPHVPLTASWYGRNDDYFRNVLLHNKPARMRERYLLAGFLINWLYLYNQTPPDSSWIWDYFPDGEEWRQVGNVHNGSVITVESILLKYANATGRRRRRRRRR